MDLITGQYIALRNLGEIFAGNGVAIQEAILVKTGKAASLRNGDTVTLTVNAKNRTCQLKPEAMLFGDSAPALMSLAVSALRHNSATQRGNSTSPFQ